MHVKAIPHKGDTVWFKAKNETVITSGIYTGGPYGEFYGITESESGKEYLLLPSEMYGSREEITE